MEEINGGKNGGNEWRTRLEEDGERWRNADSSKFPPFVSSEVMLLMGLIFIKIVKVIHLEIELIRDTD